MSSQWFAMRQQKKVSFPPGSINYMLDQMRERQTRSPLTQFAWTCTYKTPATLPSIIVSIYTLQLKSVYKRRICLVSSLQYTHTSLSFFMLDNHLTYPTHLIALISPKFDFHLQLDLLHNHTKIMMVCNLGGSPLSSACLQGQFDIMRKHVQWGRFSLWTVRKFVTVLS